MTMNSREFPVYVPTMHREFLSETVPAGVRTVWPGLPDVHGSRRDPSLWLTPSSLPFTPSQAASCMAELARLDENGIADLSVSTPAMQAVSRREITEREDLARFARSGKTAEGTARSSQRPGGEELLRWAQHYLLLGWLQEERVLDMDRLAARYRNGARKLASHLGADDEEETAIHAELLAAMTDLVPEDPAALLPSWRFMLELLSILLPPEAVFCTADDRMAGALSDFEVCDALPPELFSIPQNGEAASCVRGCVWQLIGRKEPDPDRPWLDAERTVILLTRGRA